MPNENHDIAIEAAKGAPAVAGALAVSLTMNQWIGLATGIYIVVQIFYLLRKWWREEMDTKRAEAATQREVELHVLRRAKLQRGTSPDTDLGELRDI